MHTNRLIHEKSPYLQQHAHNPVDWLAWGEEAFTKARTENKPIFLSIGYSTCHWCHVMERESFESEAIADILNRYFVSIKVDREERPDVDRIYMNFVQASTGSGGWPMSVWLTPELKPFYGGTYFPPDNRYGRPGFASVLEGLGQAWTTDRERVITSSQDVVEQLRGFSEAKGTALRGAPPLDSGFYHFRRSYDTKLGGFGPAPKFPRPSVLNFLLLYALRSAPAGEAAEHEAATMAFQTLEQMARGGMNDQLGGGFHRYSVDERWFVPHFEKMLYDQAQLAIAYIEAYRMTQRADFAETARAILDYVLRDMTDRDGGFYSAEDADSVIDPADPHEKGEGAFYIWSDRELRDLLESSRYEWFAYRYGVRPNGNVDHDPQGEFTGRNILFEQHSLAETARQFGRTEAEVEDAFAKARETLLAARNQRVRPHLDDKILTAWNGLMISAFANAGFALNEPRYVEAAEGAARFIHDRLYDRGSNQLLRRYRDGDAAIPGFLDDYAFYVQGLLDLYEANFDEHWLYFASLLTQRMRDLFEDAEGGAFFSTASNASDLIMRLKDDYDGAEPSGNSVAVLNLLRLDAIFDQPELREAAERALDALMPRLKQIPSAMPQVLVALAWSLTPPRQIVLAGEQIEPLMDILRARNLPFAVTLRAKDDTEIEKIRSMVATDQRASVYVCRNFTCELPVSDPAQLSALLQ